MTTRTPHTYADRAAHFRSQADHARTAGDTEAAGHLEDIAQRAEAAHHDRTWIRADDLRYDTDDCCTECHEHLSDPHDPGCIYGDVADATVA